jgi:SAM-dependent methyltransferase
MNVAAPRIDVHPGRSVGLRSDRGPVQTLPVARWFAEPSDAEREVLARALCPVLDVGCGPARHTLALVRAGVRAIGIDVSGRAVRIARGRGAPVLRRSVFDPLPDEGGWGTALLLDGNVGIGGNPVELLRRLRGALRRRGRILVEVEPPGTPTEVFRARIEGADPAPWFPWARIGADGLGEVASRARLRLDELWTAEGRWFGRLET